MILFFVQCKHFERSRVYTNDIPTEINTAYYAMDGQLTYLIEWLGQKAFNNDQLFPDEVKERLMAINDEEISKSQNPYLQAAAEAYKLQKNMKIAYTNNKDNNLDNLMATWKSQMASSFKVINQFAIDDLSRRIENCIISMQNTYRRLENWLTGSPQYLTPHKESSGSLVQKIESSFQETKSKLDSVKKQEAEQQSKVQEALAQRYRPPRPGNDGEEF